MTHRWIWSSVTFGLLLACNQETVLTQTDAELEVSPQLYDLGTLPVGDVVGFNLQVDHIKGGNIDIRNVTVTNIEGEYFSFGGLADGMLVLDQGAQLDVPFTYAPVDEGYHRAQVSITSTAKDSPHIVDVRARAIVPEITIWPLGIDFGPVLPPDISTRQVTISNESDVDIAIGSANISNPKFSVSDPFPVTITGGAAHDFTIVYTPVDDQAAIGTLAFKMGDVSLPEVSMRANDCDNGDPSAYDRDGDGFTSCAGDCDDDDAMVRPGGLEVFDYLDQDCDSIIDEGTEGYDDDGDGFCDHPTECSDGSTPGDCNDGMASVNPDAIEDMGNGIDDDCDGTVDAGTTDTDFDGYAPSGGDCDDTNPDVYPGAQELPDGIDNDCDLTIDEGTTSFDDDGDGYCEGPSCSDASIPGDCDDDISDLTPADGIPDGRNTNPGTSEQPDWRDNNCDGTVDEGTINSDDDGDGFTEVGGDCDDNDPTVNPATGPSC
jgi:hypothetical protein